MFVLLRLWYTIKVFSHVYTLKNFFSKTNDHFYDYFLKPNKHAKWSFPCCWWFIAQVSKWACKNFARKRWQGLFEWAPFLTQRKAVFIKRGISWKKLFCTSFLGYGTTQVNNLVLKTVIVNIKQRLDTLRVKTNFSPKKWRNFSKKSSHYWRRHWIMDIINRTSTRTRGEVRPCLELKSEEFFASRFQLVKWEKGVSYLDHWITKDQ